MEITTFKTIIDNQISNNKLHQVYLLSSNQNENFEEEILYMINKINHNNLLSFYQIKFGELYFLVDGYKKNISKEEINQSILNVSQSSIMSLDFKKILIIKKIETGSASSLNSLLKFLENPPKNVIIIMTTNNINSCLKTVKSRAFIINIHKNIEKNIDVEQQIINNINTNLSEEEKNEIIEVFHQFKEAVIISNKKPAGLFDLLIKKLNKTNYLYLANYLIYLYQDLYKLKKDGSNLDLLLSSEVKRDKYDYVLTLDLIEALNQFKKAINNNGNFEIQKANLILNFEELYGI
ncbi:DNA polymerase III [[Mycoplasma] falconis]|uniref:DNA polymerase III n=1 Tax=[Mycoplasma] falconis TaxID=92403 RepID=A0A501X9Y3_9BACT|nr:DNA polymerase III [[Mycoplasma] falconis]TPE57214.1 DNA polymerase III [[Mycoplasma] falconis]